MKNDFKLRDYQQEASEKGTQILEDNKILILNFEVRTGKTHIALDIAKNYERVLFVTTKKAMSSILSDYENAGHSFELVVINYESLHKVEGEFDLVVCDESHKLGAFPKPSKRTKLLKSIVKNDLILVSGTLTPESPAQIFHQLWISPFNPIAYANFYKFFNAVGIKKTIRTPYGDKPDYSNVPYENVSHYIGKIKLSLTQSEAGFTSKVNEHILHCDMSDTIKRTISRLKKDKIVQTSRGDILGDTGAKLMSKIHQLSSGTIKFEDGVSMVVDNSKALFISTHFSEEKIAIFYKFKEELNALKMVYGDSLTTELDEFNNTDKSIALQIVSGREGVNLSKASKLVYYNIDFSATSYWQSRDRLTTKDRTENNVYWIFSRGGIENKVYKSVMNKRDFTLNTFKREILND